MFKVNDTTGLTSGLQIFWTKKSRDDQTELWCLLMVQVIRKELQGLIRVCFILAD
jgi:hypothetical protein